MLLSAPLAPLTLRALATGSKQQVQLRHETGAPAQTTLRGMLKRLEKLGAIEKSRRNAFPGALEYELTPAGRDLLFVAEMIEHWLRRASGDRIRLGGDSAKAAIKALVDGWSSTILRALGERALSLTELDRSISALSYPSLERRLAALRLARQVEAQPGSGLGKPYAITDWAREGIGPIVAAARWERRHTPQSTGPIGQIEAETLLLLSVPLLSLAKGVSGSCRMAIGLSGRGDSRLAGVVAVIDGGRVVSCTPRLQGTPDAWALGSASAWLEALAVADVESIELGGDGQLAAALVRALSETLFGTAHRR